MLPEEITLIFQSKILSIINPKMIFLNTKFQDLKFLITETTLMMNETLFCCELIFKLIHLI
jgi:hypothetical protein